MFIAYAYVPGDYMGVVLIYTHVYVGRNLRTGSVCKLRLSVCRLDI